MGRRRSPDRIASRIERDRHLRTERFVSYHEKAIWHGRSRNARVAKVLSYMLLIRVAGRTGLPLASRPVVTCEGAGQQFFSASGEDEAAHLLPGQIVIDGAMPWLYLQGEPARLLQNEFAYADALHANFNAADRLAERNGMTDAFAAACRHVLVARGASEGDVVEAYDRIWVPGALAAITAAELELRAEPLPPALVFEPPGGGNHNLIANLDEIGRAMQDAEMRENFAQLGLLDYYRSSFDDRPTELRPDAVRALVGF